MSNSHDEVLDVISGCIQALESDLPVEGFTAPRQGHTSDGLTPSDMLCLRLREVHARLNNLKFNPQAVLHLIEAANLSSSALRVSSGVGNIEQTCDRASRLLESAAKRATRGMSHYMPEALKPDPAMRHEMDAIGHALVADAMAKRPVMEVEGVGAAQARYVELTTEMTGVCTHGVSLDELCTKGCPNPDDGTVKFAAPPFKRCLGCGRTKLPGDLNERGHCAQCRAATSRADRP